MNCQEALSLLYDVIDKEASEIDAREVEEHLKNCHDCAGVYRLERSVNELIKEKLRAQEVNPRVDNLKTKILAQLDEVDRENRPPEAAAPTSFRLGRALAIAASVIIVLGAFFIGFGVFEKHEAYLPLEESHWTASANIDAYRSNVVTSLARVQVQQDWAREIPEALRSFDLVGGQLETLCEMPVAHFIYNRDDQVVSVFFVCAKAYQLPEDLLAHVVNHNGVEFYDHNCRGCRLVYHRAGDAWVVTATTERDIDLLSFVPDRGPV
jgi:anti-sigma factor (TIGR02949 family)